MSAVKELAAAATEALNLPWAADTPDRQMRLAQMATRVAVVKGAMRFLAAREDPGESELRIAVEAIASVAEEELWYRPIEQDGSGS